VTTTKRTTTPELNDLSKHAMPQRCDRAGLSEKLNECFKACLAERGNQVKRIFELPISESAKNLLSLATDMGFLMASSILDKVQFSEMGDEVGQGVALRVFKGIKSFKQNSDFSTWVYRIAFNMSLEVARNHQRRQRIFKTSCPPASDGQLLAQIPDSTSSEPLEALQLKELREWVTQSINRLDSKNHQEIINAFYFDAQARTLDEVAKKLDLKVGTVKSRLGRALEALRDLPGPTPLR
jgi:RNA polymerase sigma-70 factor (ECF subfamily)